MKTLLGCVCAVLVVLYAAPASAQLALPSPSPAAKVMQTVGITDITVDYSSPGVKGRKIWGDLVAWDKPWRTGANAATKITFSKDVSFGGKPVPAGTYSLLTVPTQAGWTVVLNKDVAIFGRKPYDAKDDVVRVPATVTEIPLRERLAFIFSNTTEEQTSLDMEWEKVRVTVPIQMNTATFAKANIDAAVSEAWNALASAARYTAETTKDYGAALKYADNAIAIQSNWYTNWIKADILARTGKYAEARKFAQTALDLGQKESSGFFSFYKDTITKSLEEWKNKK